MFRHDNNYNLGICSVFIEMNEDLKVHVKYLIMIKKMKLKE